MKGPVLAKLVDLTECSNKIEQCFHELGVGSYGTLLMLTREMNGHEFQQAVMEAKTAKANPMSEEEKGISPSLQTRSGQMQFGQGTSGQGRQAHHRSGAHFTKPQTALDQGLHIAGGK